MTVESEFEGKSVLGVISYKGELIIASAKGTYRIDKNGKLSKIKPKFIK